MIQLACTLKYGTPIDSPYLGHMSSRPLLSLALSLQARLEEFRECGKISLVGHGLNIAAVVAVARLVLRGAYSRRLV